MFLVPPLKRYLKKCLVITDNHPIYTHELTLDLIGTGFFGGFDAEFLDQLRPQRAPWWLALAVLLALASFLAIGPFVGEVVKPDEDLYTILEI